MAKTRLNLLVDVETKRRLERLAFFHRMTQKDMVGSLLFVADMDVLCTLTPEDQERYLDRAPVGRYHPAEKEKTRLLEAYAAKFGGYPATELWCGFETDRYWYKIKLAVETGEPFRDDPGIPGAVL